MIAPTCFFCADTHPFDASVEFVHNVVFDTVYMQKALPPPASSWGPAAESSKHTGDPARAMSSRETSYRLTADSQSEESSVIV